MSDKSYFAPLVNLPVLITTPGDYRTRSGELVSIETVSERHDFRCTGRYVSGPVDCWHKSGRLLATSETANDIVQAATN